ncbi:hypothetical protein [Clostridium sp. HBUAS56010]|uniref:hypothetical protein n=1 Tax=Clostridium sp. HBUAS56010 TaxID=2571127 RepID=UPI00117800C0|nr:hypothetical protein [Clostridium sp. HBUAS56010]
MKLARKALVHFLDSSFKNAPATAEWFKVGIDMEELAVSLNPDTESSKNIWGESRVTDNGYEPSIDADPYYANPDEPLYPKLRDIAMDRLTGDDCKTLILEVIVDDDEDANHLAYVEEVIVKPQSYGGGTAGVNIPYNVAFNGGRKKGYVTKTSIDAKKPEFTEGEIPAGE